MQRPCIYGLYDVDGKLRYIGKANNPAKRLASHMRDSRRKNTPLYAWINECGKPEMRVLEADCADCPAAERRLIAEAIRGGSALLNLSPGGYQPWCPVEIARENARVLNAKLDENPRAKKLRDIKRRVATGLRLGQLGEVQKQKFRDLAAYRPDLFSCWAHI